MPCRDDYSPSCNDSEFSKIRTNLRKARDKNDFYTRLLCFIMTNITIGEREMLYNLSETEEHGNAADELKAWWAEHQEADRMEALRKERERNAAAKKAAELAKENHIKRQALLKLTLEERKLLGLS